MAIESVERAARDIFNRRVDAGTMSVKLMSQLIGLAPSHISNFRHNERGLSVDSLSRMIVALGFDVELIPRLVKRRDSAAHDLARRVCTPRLPIFKGVENANNESSTQ